jgi:peptidoglycan/xylan/chitin deacetylase (PgdA/CDA1 family)
MSLRLKTESLLGSGLIATGLHRALLGDQGVLVAFHRINDHLPEGPLTRTSKDFEAFCVHFRRYYDVLTLSEFISRLERKQSLAGSLVITFDDGYLGNYEIAVPILQKLGIPATFFVVSGFIGSMTVPWWDRDLPQHPGWMTWDQLRSMARAGFEIGGHTRTHVDLGKVAGSEATDEIVGCRADLERELGVVPQHFAYPYGQRDNLLESNRQRVIEAGFRSCVSCYGGLVPARTDAFHLQRVPISPWFRTPAQLTFESVMHRV